MSEADWFWEGNVVAAIAAHLKADGWRIIRLANTTSKESGADIRAEKDGRCLVVEVKGYPSLYYQHGPKKGAVKRTTPATQARHWFGEAMLSGMLRTVDPAAGQVALGFPKFEVYMRLLNRLAGPIGRLGLAVFIVAESSTVTMWDPREAGSHDAK